MIKEKYYLTDDELDKRLLLKDKHFDITAAYFDEHDGDDLTLEVSLSKKLKKEIGSLIFNYLNYIEDETIKRNIVIDLIDITSDIDGSNCYFKLETLKFLFKVCEYHQIEQPEEVGARKNISFRIFTLLSNWLPLAEGYENSASNDELPCKEDIEND